MKIAPAVRARPVLKAFHALRAPCALERADVRLLRGGNVAVAAFTVGANLKHVATLNQGTAGDRMPSARCREDEVWAALRHEDGCLVGA